ncbi:hypothetical protein ACQ4LE_009232 [Meloidogyne hapla]
MFIQLLFLIFILNDVKSYKIGQLNFKENTTLSVNNTEETASKINDYLSYNIQTNIFNNQTIEFLPLNYTEIYQSLLNKISNNCLTANEVVEMVGNRYKAGFAVWHLNILTEPAVKQIGINELRIGFRLKTQKTKTNLNGIEREEFENKNNKNLNNSLSYIEEKFELNFKVSLAKMWFWPEDLKNVEQFLDKKFPEIRKLFKLKYEEIQIYNKQFNNQKIDELFKEFREF